MSDSLYKIYQNDTIKLVRSMVIKSVKTAEAINQRLVELNQSVSNNPKEWKYYLNLSGEYHYTDTPMEVVSLDTLETIPFTKAYLEVHKTTKLEYTFNSSYYLELLDKYPGQESLIRGILNPIDIDEAVNADDYAILYYDVNLIEENEYGLVESINKWIRSFMLKHNVEGYHLASDLYTTALLGCMYSHLPTAILNLRLDNCKTNRVHSYHLWTYLASNARLNKYRRTLTIKQALFLYRNIHFLLANAGKSSTLDILIERMLTERGFPVYGYDIRHQMDTFNEYLQPEVEVVRTQINEAYETYSLKPVNTVKYLHELLEDKAKSNGDDIDRDTLDVTNKMSVVGRNVLHTKVLESIATVESINEEITLSEVLFSEWVTLSVDGYYDGFIRIPHPITGENMLLKPIDALILFIFVLNRSIGVTLDEIPSMEISKALVYGALEYDDMHRIWGYEPHTWDKHLMDYAKSVPDIERIINPVAFLDYSRNAYNILKSVEMYGEVTGDYQVNQRSIVLLNELRQKRAVNLVSVPTSYSQWLSKYELTAEDFNVHNAKDFATTVLETTTGLVLSEMITPADIMSDLIDIVDRLTSYNVTFVKTIANENAFPVSANLLRLQQPDVKHIHRFRDFNVTIDTLSIEQGSNGPEVKVPYHKVQYNHILKPNLMYNVNPLVKVKMGRSMGETVTVIMPKLKITIEE